MYEKAQKELALKDRRIKELEDIVADYVKDEAQYLKDTEDSLKIRRIKAESLLHELR